MRAFRLLVVACGLVLLLTACNSSTTGNGSGESSSSGRAIFREGRSSVGSAASVASAASAQSSSTKAPFFSLKGSSSSAAAVASSARAMAVTSSAGAASSRSSAAAAAAGRTKLYVEADRTEVRPGDPVTLSVTVKNTSSVTIANMQVVTSYLPSQLVVTDSEGSQAQPGNSVWSIQSLAPNQKRTLRIPATVAATLIEGDVIRTNTIAAINNVVEPDAYPYQFTIVSQAVPLPQTGGSDALSPLENTRRFLTPFRAGGSNAMPLIVWTATIGMGMALGVRGMKRYL